MKKVLLTILTSFLFVPLAFAQNNGTSSAPKTWTGVWCNTSSGTSLTLSWVVAQETFVNELSRLLNVKKNAYTAAFTLTGTARTNALTAANTAFKTGLNTAVTNFRNTKQAIRSSYEAQNNCQLKNKNTLYQKLWDKKDERKLEKEARKAVKQFDKKNRGNKNWWDRR